MLTKNPNERLSVKQVLKHPWCLLLYKESDIQQPFQTYTVGNDTPIDATIEEHEKSSMKKNQVQACDTTMRPFLEQIFLKEIENDLKEYGSLVEDSDEYTTQDQISGIYFFVCVYVCHTNNRRCSFLKA